MLLNTGKSDAVLLVPSQTGDHKGVELPLADSNASVMAGALSPDGLYAAVLQDNGTVSVWNTRRAALIALFGEPDQKISNLAFPPDLNAIDALGQDGSVYRWRIFTDTIDLADAVSAAIPKNLASDRKQRIIDEASTPPASAQ
jgi:WD40 repeat protein